MSGDVSFNEKNTLVRKRKKKVSGLTRLFITLHVAGDERGARVAMIALAIAAMITTGYDLWDAFGHKITPSFDTTPPIPAEEKYS